MVQSNYVQAAMFVLALFAGLLFLTDDGSKANPPPAHCSSYKSGKHGNNCSEYRHNSDIGPHSKPGIEVME